MHKFSCEYQKEISGIIHQEADARSVSLNSSEHPLHMENLKVFFRTAGKDLPAVDKISMSLSAGNHIALRGKPNAATQYRREVWII
jgi:ABC-type transport system involved in cytochrome bd biosynthesis fused ATPase/permease subunit